MIAAILLIKELVDLSNAFQGQSLGRFDAKKVSLDRLVVWKEYIWSVSSYFTYQKVELTIFLQSIEMCFWA